VVTLSADTAPGRIAIAILFTDIEASTRTWEEQPQAMAVTLRRHDEIVRRAVARHHGHVFSTGGDGFGVAFPTVSEAVAAAVDAQRSLRLADLELPIRVRMGIHAGEAEARDDDYFGPDLNRAARIMGTAHGGQIVLSAFAATQLSATGLPRVELRDLGSHRLKDILAPEHILQVVVDDLPAEFPPLRTRRTGNIPHTRPIAIGRGGDVARVAAALAGRRLVTVVGPVGPTATAIALGAARAADAAYPNGTWHLDLDDLTGPDDPAGPDDLADLAPALADALAVELDDRTPAVAADRLARALAGGDALVVLSGGHLGGHLGGDLATAVAGLLDRLPTASVLVVADAPLDLPEAHTVELARRGLPPDLARFRERPLVGRGPELDRLRDLVTDAHATGRRRLVLVGGEEGMGKSRLVAELADELTGADGLVLRGAWSEEGVTAFQALKEAFGRHLADVDPADLDDRFADLLPALGALLPTTAPSVGAVPDLDRYALLDALDTWLARLADVQPLLLWLDDLQWADPSSLQVLQHLARAPRPAPVAIVCTYQPASVARGDDVAGALTQLRRDPGYERIDLTGLSPKASGALVEQTVTARLTPRTVALLHSWSGGNPYYLRELALLVDEAAVPGPDGVAVADLGEVGVPESLRDVVQWRLARRSPRLHEVLTAAAVIGTTFGTATLAATLDADHDEIDSLVDEGVALGFLEETDLPGDGGRGVQGGDDELRFAKDLVRQALYDELSPRRRNRLHRRVLDVLLADPDADPGAVVRHLGVIAGPDDLGRTVEYATNAAHRATDQLAYENAARHLDDALAVLDRHPDVPAPRTELLVAAGEAHTRAGAIGVGRDRLRRAVAGALAEGADDLLARAGLAWGGVPPASPPADPEAVEVLGAVVERHPGDRAERALALARQAEWLHREEPYARRRALVDEAVAIAERIGDPAVLGWVRHSALQALHGPDEAEAAVDAGEEIVALGQRAHDDELAFQGWRMLLGGLFAVGRMEETLQVAATVRRVGERLRQPEYLRIAVMWDATVATMEGRFDDALHLATEAHTVTLTGDHSQHADIQLMLRIPRFGLRGASPRVLTMLEDLDYADVHPMLAWYHAEAGDHDRARELLDVDGLVTRIAERRWYLFWAEVVGYGSAAAVVGDTERAAALRDLIAPYRGHLAVLGISAFLGTVTHHTGVLSGVLGDWDRAVADLEDAVTDHRDMGARPWVALSRVELARVLAARGATGDAVRAEALTAEAVAVADELGLRAVHGRAGRPLAAAG
jgi:class 3 adenylate cyclase